MLIKAKIKWVCTMMIMMAGLFTVPVLAQSVYGSSYYDDYRSRYWSDRYRRESYRFFWPPRVHRSFSIGFPYEYYGYSPYYPPSYGNGYYGQYPQYQQQPEQPEQPKQMTKEEIEQAAQEEVTRQMDNISQAFVAGNYGRAVVRAREAVKQMPNNTTMRLIYSQTLFADGKYPNAAIALRSTFEKMLHTGQQNVYYAVSLYPDQDTLNKQIDKLAEAVKATPSSSNLNLLLGYQLLGVGRTDEGLGYLQKAAQDSVNEKAALFLVRVSSKINHNFEQMSGQGQVEPKAPSGKVEQKPIGQNAKTSGTNAVNGVKRKVQKVEPNY